MDKYYVDEKVLEIVFPDEGEGEEGTTYDSYTQELTNIIGGMMDQKLEQAGIDEAKRTSFLEDYAELQVIGVEVADGNDVTDSVKEMLMSNFSKLYEKEMEILDVEFNRELAETINQYNAGIYDYASKNLSQEKKDELNAYLDQIEAGYRDAGLMVDAAPAPADSQSTPTSPDTAEATVADDAAATAEVATDQPAAPEVTEPQSQPETAPAPQPQLQAQPQPQPQATPEAMSEPAPQPAPTAAPEAPVDNNPQQPAADVYPPV